MKRAASQNNKHEELRQRIRKIRRRERAHTAQDVFEAIYEACFQRWCLLCVVLDSSEIPRDIGLVVMHLFMCRDCTECGSLVQCPPKAHACMACYNADIRCRPYEGRGILCGFCGPRQLEKCVSCEYTQCNVHGMFDTDETNRCTMCENLICSQCCIDENIITNHTTKEYYPVWCGTFMCGSCTTRRK